MGLMKDDGNFQLRDQNFVVLWQSFNHFTDTLLPGQVLNSKNCLYSRQGEFNFSRGMFELRLEKDGHGLLLNLINSPSNTYYSTQHDAYYESRIVYPYNEPLDVGDKLIFDKDYFSLYILIKENGKHIPITNSKNYVSNGNYYYKATINHDGVFTLSYYPRNPTNVQRWIVAKTIPENICLNSTSNNGICGLNSICSLRDDQRPKCTCQEGYSLIDSNNMYGGCIPNFQVNICQCRHQGSQNDTQIMRNLSNTYSPKFDYQPLSTCTLQECKEYCMQDGWCVLVFVNESSCWKNKLPLSHGRKDLSMKGTSIIKIRRNDTLSILSNVIKDNVHNNTKKMRDYGSLMIVMSIILGFSIVIIIALCGPICFWHNHKKIKSSATNISVVDRNLRIFTYKEITEATNNFREELGRGSCSIVYKGTIDVDMNVAVKKLDKLFQDSDKEFQTEMNVIIETHHRNLVRLHGYCSEEQHRVLVYELMSNGTLASFLFTPLKPSWSRRVQIAIGIARGLVYLHEECCTQIIHCDIKPQNILLDDDYNARISDFGLAKLLLINQSHTKTGIRGTKGYVAPDWFRSAPITAKVDAYSFGVLLLEIIFCRKNVEGDNVSEEKRILTDWAYDCYKATKLDLLLENEGEAIDDMSRVEKFVMIAIWCTQEDPSIRPTMKRVLLMLEEIVEVAIPPSPYLYGSFG
ncbi:G-type lectin S-receptor-like serine/threonine-protein kinase LECRK3 [Trifolium pratense]|uniref:G-type lectin S-receptor-like serine/threonine-protein kinase LECRK3 n=1 Tax=Trifolium pratense TaxID=57577 RepID=UPI001E6926E4|nr:G-type lectin S-receptor-like serine/threonine-protein kinase LECRK3 [Trifolium pratense]